MPYVKQEKRPGLDKIVDFMSRVFVTYKSTPHGIKSDLEELKADGDLNYVLFAFCKRHVKPSYNNYKNYIAELHECASWIEHELLFPYEELKKKENGDVE